ncbi:MAG: type II toxin-antitoxin system RelE/ParE family toxin [Candidatus Hydrogenedentes bacterium]|nr:type II toxin-antitoxin system RelE/ParE family toxin [Candidatus Hydrogenedentota bacterium]
MSYEFHTAAELEYLEAIAFYEFRRPGIGLAFLDEFEGAMEIVTRSPDLYPIEIEPDIRRVAMKRFPFSIIYRRTASRLQVLAVAHQSRRPSYWLDRL